MKFSLRTIGRAALLTFAVVYGTVLLPGTAVAQEIEDLRLAVYSNGLGLVSEVRSLNLVRGANTVVISGVPTKIDPTSVRMTPIEASDTIQILTQRYIYNPLTRDSLLDRFVGQEVELGVEGSGTLLSGVLLNSIGDIALRSDGGRVDLIPRQAVERVSVSDMPEDLLTEPSLVWLVESPTDQRDHRLGISYLTEGLNWHVEYSAVVKADDESMKLTSWASIENRSGASYENAELTLVAGEVNRVQGNRKAVLRERFDGVATMSARVMPQFEEQKAFEYHSYRLSGRTALENNGVVQLTMLGETDVSVGKHYVFDGAMHPSGVQTRFRLENSKQTGLGLPMPRGTVRMYQTAEDGTQLYIGEDRIIDLAKDETAYLTVGQAFDLQGARVQVSSRQPSKGVVEERYEITLRNHSEKAVAMKVIEHMRQGPNWKVRDANHDFTQTDSRTIEFDIQVDRDGATIVEYSVEYRRSI